MDAATVSALIEIFKDLAIPAFGIAFTFGFGAKIIKSLLSMGLDGRFKI